MLDDIAYLKCVFFFLVLLSLVTLPFTVQYLQCTYLERTG